MLHYINAIIIGLVQGLTEFLPVSSSGHLVISQQLLGIKMPGLTFEIFLHFGTLISVFWVFRERLFNIIMSFVALFSKNEWSKFSGSGDRWFGLLLIVGSIPTAAIGFLVKGHVEEAFSSPTFVGVALLFTGVLLWVADTLPGGNKDIHKTTVWDALLIGTFQGLAVFPGISRSGSTISGALFRNMDKRTAAEYSFLLSVPAILGATLLEVFDLIQVNAGVAHDWLFYLLGVVASAVAGIFAINIFIKLLVKNKLRYFSVYVWIVGILVIIIL
jgi:undecaprenyl-diphosphatase